MDRVDILIKQLKMDFETFCLIFTWDFWREVLGEYLIFFIITFTLFPFMYVFLILLSFYKFVIKYLFLILDCIVYLSIKNKNILDLYEYIRFFLYLVFFQILFKYLPVVYQRIMKYRNPKERKKVYVAILRWLDDRAYNTLIYFERKIPIWWYKFKIWIFLLPNRIRAFWRIFLTLKGYRYRFKLICLFFPPVIRASLILLYVWFLSIPSKIKSIVLYFRYLFSLIKPFWVLIKMDIVLMILRLKRAGFILIFAILSLIHKLI